MGYGGNPCSRAGRAMCWLPGLFSLHFLLCGLQGIVSSFSTWGIQMDFLQIGKRAYTENGHGEGALVEMGLDDMLNGSLGVGSTYST